MSQFAPDQATEHVPTRDGYDRWAEFYDADDNPLVAIEEPIVRGLVGDVAGLSVLDVGCGTGRHSAWLARAGANVQALDFSEAMLKRARAKSDGLNVNFQVHDLAGPLPFPDRTFDCIVCGLVIDHIADLHALFREMGRVCRTGGAIVASTVHPAMMLKGVQARFRDPASGREVRPASCSHQISDYVVAAVRAGLRLDSLSEHTVESELAETHERARKYLGWPILFVMRLSP